MNKINRDVYRKKELLEFQKKLLIEKKQRFSAQDDFIEFCKRVYPGYIVGKHHRYIADCMKNAIRRKSGWTRLIIHEPPQHGKSLQLSILFPAFYLGNFPNDPIILTAYNDLHALTFSKKIRNIIDSELYADIFPGMELSDDTRGAQRWELKNARGAFSAAGLGGGITGKGAMLLIIDDPVKNRREVESKTFREQQKEDYRSTLKTRLHNQAIEFCIMTRWHEDDLGAYLIREHGFNYIRIPAIAGVDDVLGRGEGEALWPEKFPLPFLDGVKESLGSYNWSSMYQGDPAPPEGLLFKRSHFLNVVDKSPKGLSWIRFWDLATSESTDGDYTASFKTAVDYDGNVYVDGGIRGKWDWPKVRNLIKLTAKQEPGVLIGIESQGPQKGMVQECWADIDLVNVGILAIPTPASKRVRSLPIVARAEAGKLVLVRGQWIDEFVEEFIHFDVGEHDDQVDALSGCFHMLGYSSPGIVNLNELLEESKENNEIEEPSYFSSVWDEDMEDHRRIIHFT